MPQTQRTFYMPKETIAFAYLYNIKPDDEILDVDFNGYKILTIDTFRERYSEHLHNLLAINFPAVESVMTNLVHKYVLIATKLPSSTGALEDVNNIEPNLVFGAFVNTVLYFRLFTSCDLQIGTFFISYKNQAKPTYRNIFHTDLMCFLSEVPYIGYNHIRQDAELKLGQVTKIVEFIQKFEKRGLKPESELWLALSAFNRACNTSDIFYKITGFVTTLECLLADDGKEGEISFKLRTRLVHLLKDAEIAKFIRDIYALRSHIAHKGGFTKSSENTQPAYLWSQIKAIEILCQKTLLYIMQRFIEEDGFKLQDIRSELDTKIFTKLAN